VFEWDRAKAAANLLKHGVSFEEAATVFADPQGLDGHDLRHSVGEARFLRIGKSVAGRVLIVAYTVRRRDNEEIIRIISSRQASKKERTFYGQSS
jgi:uncharacterized protein